VALVNAPRLHPDLQARLPSAVLRPGYERAALRGGIVHLGLGAFARAHLALATEAALQAGGDTRWCIVGVSLRHADTRDALAPQAGLYSVALRDADAAGAPRQRLQVVGCVIAQQVASEDPQAVLERIAAADTRIVSLTVTEKGYCHDPAGDVLRIDHADIVHDLAHPAAPRSAIGFIVRGLALRRARGLEPLTLPSLDNLPSNGRLLRGAVLALAAEVDAGLRDWIAAQCAFPSSMVDRIVPRTTPEGAVAVSAALGCRDAWPVIAEPYFDWAVEDSFAAGRPDWQRGGARFVDSAAPWERLKLRRVNGAHSVIAYLGVMAGWRTVDEAEAQPALRRHLIALLRDEVEPTLPSLPALDRTAFRTALLAHFANPALAHRCAQIAIDGSQKLPQRWLGTVRERLAAGQAIDRLALGIAAWLHHLRGVDESGATYAIDDPLATELSALWRAGQAVDDPVQRARRLLDFAPVFGNLAGNEALAAAVAPHLNALRSRGVVAALERLAD
jgi:fructuronate reductase